MVRYLRAPCGVVKHQAERGEIPNRRRVQSIGLLGHSLSMPDVADTAMACDVCQDLAPAATFVMPARATFSRSVPGIGCRPAAENETMLWPTATNTASTTTSMPWDFAVARNARVWSPRFGNDSPVIVIGVRSDPS